jgi:hypothetical protein
MGLPILALGFFSAPPAIVVDGNVTDWVRVTAGYHERQIETPIRSISVTGDGERVFVHFEFVKPQGLLALPGTLTLVADSDNNPNTGTLKEGLAGADIALEFSPNTCAVIVFTQAGPTEVKCGDPNLGLTLAPSFAATDAELAISRFGTVGTRSDLFSAGRVRWKMLFRDKAGLVREGQFVSRLPDARRHPAMTGKGDPLQRASGTDLRVATWNVANRSWNQHPEPYRRILRGLQPDIVLLVEVLDRSTETWIRSFFDSLGAQSGAWQFVESKTGGWDRCLVASRLPLTGAFDEVRHTSQTIQRLGPVMDKPVANPAAPHKTMEDGITSTAAYIEIGGRIVLTTAVHVACCDNLAGRSGGPAARSGSVGHCRKGKGRNAFASGSGGAYGGRPKSCQHQAGTGPAA